MTNLHTLSPVAITAYASICAAGVGKQALQAALLANEAKLNPLTLFDIAFSTRVGEVVTELPKVNAELRIYDSRNARMALAALNHVEDNLRPTIGLAKNRYGGKRIGVIIGTSTSGLYETEAAYCQLVEQGHMPDDFHFLTRHAYQATPRFLQLELGLSGPCFAISTACSSGAKAIGVGQRLITNDVCDAVLVGGVDTLCRLTLRGFRSLDLVSASQCRPMDKNRNGINIGEGAGLLLLEKSTVNNSGCPRILAVGESSDGYHMSSPHPDGHGAHLAMENALRQAGLQPGEIDYLNLHATATPINDSIEAKAVFALLGDALPVSGTKGITGHTLGAAGALEAVIVLLALANQFVPGTSGLNEIDHDCRCRVVKEPIMQQPLKTAMSNSFGFGGNNASIIFDHERA